MKLTDPKVLKMLKKVCSYELEYQIESYPDDERYGRSDMEFLADEVSYQIMLFHEDECTWKEALQAARALLRKTKYGREIPLDIRTFRPLDGYSQMSIEDAKRFVNEYNRIFNLLKRLQKQGFYGQWYYIDD